MKRMSKKIAIMLVLVVIFSQLNTSSKAEAAEAPGLRYTSKVIYVDGDSLNKYTDNCWVPSKNTTGYSVKYQVTSNPKLITISKNGKVTATGNGVGSAVVKVSYIKSGQRDITADFTVKVRRNAKDVKLTNKSVGMLDTAINVGESVKFEAAKSYDGSYVGGHYGLDNYRGVVNDTLKIESLTPDIATANGLTLTAKAPGTAKFVVKAYQYGDNKFTGVISTTYSIVVKDPTPAIIVTQTSLNTISLKSDKEFTSAPSTSSIRINKISSNYSMDIRSVTVDSTDKAKLIIETYASLNDNTKYEVVYNNEKYEFLCSDGVIADMTISPVVIEENTPTEIYVTCYDSKGIMLGKYDMNTAYNVGIEFSIDSNYGYPEDNKYTLFNEGDTAKAKAVYHTLKYDDYGKEIGTITKEATIIAKKASAVTTGPYQYTIASSEPNYSSLTTANEFIEVMQQGQNVYFYIKNSKGEDISYQYTLKSSNVDVLIVGPTMQGSSKGIYANVLALTGNNPKAYILVLKDNQTVYTLPVTIRAEAKLTRIDIDKTSLSLSNSVNSDETVKITLYDQYGRKMTDEYPVVTCLSAPSTAGKALVDSMLSTYAKADLGKVVFNAYGISEVGTYTYKLQVGDYSRVVTINVAAPNPNATSVYKIVLSNTSIDTAVSSTDSANKELTIRVAELKGNIVSSYLPVSSVSLVVKNSSGENIYPNPDGNNTWKIPIVDISTNPVTKLQSGAYTITATINKITTSSQFTITDSQGGVTAGLVTASVNSGTWQSVLAAAFDFIYQNSNVDSYITSLTYIDHTGTSTVSATNYISAGTYNIKTVTLNIKISDTLYVPITVSVGKTITVK